MDQRGFPALKSSASPSFPIAKVQDQVKLAPSASSLASSLDSCESAALIFIDIGHGPSASLTVKDSRVPMLHLQAPTTAIGKKRYLNPVLNTSNIERCVSFARMHLAANHPAVRPPTLCVASIVGENDLLVGVTIAILQCMFDDEGQVRDLSSFAGDGDIGTSNGRIGNNLRTYPFVIKANASKATKETLRTRLQWIQTGVPELNPSRTVLKLINTYFMSPKQRRAPPL